MDKYERSNLTKILNWPKFPMSMLTISTRMNVDNATNLKYVSKICGLNFEIVTVTQPCIKLFSFR